MSLGLLLDRKLGFGAVSAFRDFRVLGLAGVFHWVSGSSSRVEGFVGEWIESVEWGPTSRGRLLPLNPNPKTCPHRPGYYTLTGAPKRRARS